MIGQIKAKVSIFNLYRVFDECVMDDLRVDGEKAILNA